MPREEPVDVAPEEVKRRTAGKVTVLDAPASGRQCRVPWLQVRTTLSWSLARGPSCNRTARRFPGWYNLGPGY